MNIINKPIEMVAVFSKDGSIKPIRFRTMDDNEEWQTIYIKSIQHKYEEKIGNSKELVRRFLCLVEINGFQRLCEIEYNLYSTMWTLVKM